MLLAPAQKVIRRPDMLAHLRETIGRLEGIQHRPGNSIQVNNDIDKSLPNSALPIGCVHEIQGTNLASAVAFSALLSSRIPKSGTILYIAPDRSFYPLGLLPSGLKLEQWIHVSARRLRDLEWAVLEALRCPQVKAVLAVMTAADLTFCRRLQLAAEGSGATGFLLHHTAHSSSIASAITRWQVSPARGTGRKVGEAFWKLELQYCRGGHPGKWMVTCRDGNLETLECLSEFPARPVLTQETALAG